MVHRSRDCDGDDQLAIDASINFNYTFDFLLTQNVEGIASGIFEIRESFSRLNSMVEENIGGNRVVKAFLKNLMKLKSLTSTMKTIKMEYGFCRCLKNIYRG